MHDMKMTMDQLKDTQLQNKDLIDKIRGLEDNLERITIANNHIRRSEFDIKFSDNISSKMTPLCVSRNASHENHLKHAKPMS